MRSVLLFGILLVSLSTSVLARGDLWTTAFSGRYDTTSSGAYEILVKQYWTGNPDSTRKYLPTTVQHLARYKSLGKEDLSIMRLELCLGLLYKHVNDPTKAIRHHFAALGLADKLKLPLYTATINMEIGLIYYMQANWERSISFFTKSMDYFRSIGDSEREMVRAYLIGLAMNNSGRYAESLPLFHTIYAYHDQQRDTNRLLECGTGLANALRGAGYLDSSEARYKQLQEIAVANNDHRQSFHATVHAGIAQVYYELGRLVEAEREAIAALNASGVSDYFIPRLEAQKLLYHVYRKRGDHQHALQYLELYTRNHDSLLNKENTAKMSVSQALYEYQRKEDALMQEESRKRQVMIIVASLTSVLVIVIFLFYRSLAKQKGKTESLLENILPKDTIAELKKQGAVTPRIHHNVTIMFCDVKDFTIMAEELSPEVLVELLDHYFRSFDEIVVKHGLEKIKTIGDAYMVAGGLHDASVNSAQLCIKAAIDMLRYIDETSVEFTTRYGHAFGFRIGLHTGSVVSGVVGRDKYAYDIWGDAVNTASRIEQQSEVGLINLSGSTYEQIKDLYPCRYRGKISAKNKGDVDMYFLER